MSIQIKHALKVSSNGIRAAAFDGCTSGSSPLPPVIPIAAKVVYTVSLYNDRLVLITGDAFPSAPFWRFVIADDYDSDTVPLYVVQGASITPNSALGTFAIIMNGTNTAAMIEALGASESRVFKAELSGYDAQGDDEAVQVIQFDVCVGSRVNSSVTTHPIDSSVPFVIFVDQITGKKVKLLISGGVPTYEEID